MHLSNSQSANKNSTIEERISNHDNFKNCPLQVPTLHFNKGILVTLPTSVKNNAP